MAAVAPADTEPPRIVISYPPEGAKVDREQVVVIGLVTDNVDVDRVFVSLNGKMVTMSPEQAVGQRGYSIRTLLTIEPGENVIEVTAVDPAGNVAQAVRSVTRITAAGASPAPTAATPAR